MKAVQAILLLSCLITLSACGVRSIPKAKNNVEASVAEVTNQYKRRADLIPNLVKTVKAYANHEKGTLQAVINARSKATSTNINANNLTADQIKKFQQAQSGLSQALSRLMVVVEKYPNLKADRNFRELQAQLEGTENRITVARNRNIEAIKHFNNQVTVPPESLINNFFYKYKKLPQWNLPTNEVEQIKKAPTVDFN